MSLRVSELGGDQDAAMRGSAKHRAHVRTLVVDDSADLLNAICTMIEMHDGVAVVGRATNGREAVDAAIRLLPDLVLMDVQMPNMNGLTAAELIHEVCPETPVVLMSADASYGDRDIVVSCAAAFIDKLEFVHAFPRVLEQLALTEGHAIPS